EESFVRGLWAQRPMVWQAYRQAEGAHLPKVRAFVERWVEAAEPGPAAAAALARMETAWNDDMADVPQALDALIPALPALRDASARWARANGARPDLATRLAEFVAGKLY
ncbi:MAG: DUF2331 family protein, partial [Burkholderiales bacterium]